MIIRNEFYSLNISIFHDRHPDRDLQQDLEDRRMADHTDLIPGYHTPNERQLELCQNYRTISLISHPSKVMLKIILNRLQPKAEEIIAEKQAGFIYGIWLYQFLIIAYLFTFQSRKEQHRTNIQSQDPRWKIPAASAESLPCLHRLQEILWQGMARSLMCNYEEIQHQHQHHTSHWNSVCPECSPVQWQHRRMVQNYSRRSPTRVSALTNPL